MREMQLAKSEDYYFKCFCAILAAGNLRNRGALHDGFVKASPSTLPWCHVTLSLPEPWLLPSHPSGAVVGGWPLHNRMDFMVDRSRSTMSQWGDQQGNSILLICDVRRVQVIGATEKLVAIPFGAKWWVYDAENHLVKCFCEIYQTNKNIGILCGKKYIPLKVKGG